MKKVFFNQYDQVQENKTTVRGEDLDYDTDLTVPDQSLTIRDIIERFSTGQPINALRNVYFDENEGMEVDETLDPNFDLADASRLAEEIRQRQKEAEKQALKNASDELAKAEAQKAAELEAKKLDEQKANESEAGSSK